MLVNQCLRVLVVLAAIPLSRGQVHQTDQQYHRAGNPLEKLATGHFAPEWKHDA
jgi:hypothetical protein